MVAYEQITLFGLIVVGRRPMHYGPVDPVVSRELFIREALVRGEIQSRAKCLSANTKLLEQLDELEAKARRRDILADEDTLFAFYVRLPAEIHQTATFDSWYRINSQKDPQLLIMREEDVLAREASEVTAAHYPDTLRVGDLTLPLSYHFEPNHPRDGVTLRVPAPLADAAAGTPGMAGAGGDRSQVHRPGAQPAQGLAQGTSCRCRISSRRRCSASPSPRALAAVPGP